MAIEVHGIAVEPSQAIRHLRRKEDVTTARWYDMVGEAHAKAFTVAGATKLDLLADIRQEVQKALDDGISLQAFKTGFKAIAEKHGWDYYGSPGWRSDVVMNTNLRTAYAAGRWEQLQEVKKTRPFWEYSHSHESTNPRKLHLGWDGMVLPADDPWWNMGYPPNGWGCNCKVHALSQHDLNRLGKSVGTAPAVEFERQKVAGNWVNVPKGFDYGWDYNVGKADQSARVAKVYMDKVTQADPLIGAASMMSTREKALAQIGRGYRPWLEGLERLPNSGSTRGERVTVGAFSSKVVRGMAGAGVPLESAGIGIEDHDALRLMYQARRGKELSLDVIQHLPEHMADPAAVYLDQDRRDVLVVLKGQGKAEELQVVRMALPAPSRDPEAIKRPADIVLAGLVKRSALEASRRFLLLDGAL